MDIKKVLNEFVKECSNKLDLLSIIQFGSSTHSEDFHDIDLVFMFKEDIVPTKTIFDLIEIIKNFEKEYSEIVFDFGGVSDRKRVAKNSITVIPLGKKDINVIHNPHDIFFYKNLNEDKKKIILFGKDPFDRKFNLTNQHLFEMLTVELNHSLRKSLDDDKTKFDSLYFLFKTFLRAMLINEGTFQKKELLEEFKNNFKDKIKLPKNSKDIIKKKIITEDFGDILKFSEDCLRYLIK